MSRVKNKNWKVGGLIAALVLVLAGGVLFMGAVSGWFDDSKTILDHEYYQDGAKFIELDAEEYERLIDEKKSFVVFVDQPSCKTADRLREYMTEYMTSAGVSVYKMMFSEVKKSSLHDFVKYYPSVAIIDKGKLRAYLKADSDADAEAYNDYDAFQKWINQFL